jgi:enoyl-CoA hydratase/carnithine racemase
MAHVVRTSFDGSLATIQFTRPDARNAISLELIAEFRAALAEVTARAAASPESARVAIISGEGKAFCAGMDLKAVADDPIAMGRMLHELARALLELRRLPMPTIARVQGAAIGGGCGFVAVCDFAVTHPEAKLGYPEVELGVCPAVVAPWLVRRIGAGPARAMLLLGGTITGHEAHARGLVTHCVEAGALDAQVSTLAASLASGGRLALACTKRLLNELDGSLDERIAEEAASLSARVISSEEAQQRIAVRFAAPNAKKGS